MTAEQRAKTLDKIKKCLALSKSPEPHEAAAAMRQAQKLMDRAGISAEEVGLLEMGEATVKTREGFGKCLVMSKLRALLAKVFGVQAFGDRNPGSANRLNVVYVGPIGRVKLAEYTHRVIQRALDDAWSAHLLECPEDKSSGGKREAFRIGWLAAVESQVEAMEVIDDEVNAMALYIKRNHGEIVTTSIERDKMDMAAYLEGLAAAQSFSLNRPLEQEALKIGHG
jgi:hypothetical protein